MGVCGSREVRRRDTAKLILPDGSLQEFESPVKVWQILQKNPTSFICNSDDMDFDDTVSAINGSEDLRLGQLYFVLPLTWLNYPLRPEEMAALAVKASSALTKNGAWDEHWACGEYDSFSGEKSHRKVSSGEKKGRKVRRNGTTVFGGGGKGKRSFPANLTTISE